MNGHAFCQYCGAETKENQEMCLRYGTRLGKLSRSSTSGNTERMKYCGGVGIRPKKRQKSVPSVAFTHSLTKTTAKNVAGQPERARTLHQLQM